MNRIFVTVLFLLVNLLPLMAQKNLLRKFMESRPEAFRQLLDAPEQYDIQIIYTQIDRDKNNLPHFKQHSFQLDKNSYFYPASTVKMPMAFLALEKINQLKIKGLDKNSAMKTESASPPQTAADADSTAASGLPSVAHYVKKIFLVSDNDASNRLYEFLGQQALNEALWSKGYKNTRITHRLGITGFDAEANRHTNPVSFFDGEKMLYYPGEVYSKAGPGFFDLKKTLRGKGYLDGDSLVNQPFDFSEKNYVSLQDFHDLLLAVIFPEVAPSEHLFDLTADDYRFLYRVMSEKPLESQFPRYHEPDHYCKFFLFGNQKKEERMPPNIRIFNKVGWAYGFLTDVAYIVDFEAGVEFFLAATIHVNADGIFNDDHYEYETIGLPFFANLGQVVYDFEKKRKRKFKPDLSKFVVEGYD